MRAVVGNAFAEYFSSLAKWLRHLTNKWNAVVYSTILGKRIKLA